MKKIQIESYENQLHRQSSLQIVDDLQNNLGNLYYNPPQKQEKQEKNTFSSFDNEKTTHDASFDNKKPLIPSFKDINNMMFMYQADNNNYQDTSNISENKGKLQKRK